MIGCIYKVIRLNVRKMSTTGFFAFLGQYCNLYFLLNFPSILNMAREGIEPPTQGFSVQIVD